MRIQTKTYTRTVSSAQVEDVGDFELSFPVADWVDQHIRVEGDKAVIGYLVSDSDCENPMTSNDGMGEFITDDDRRSNWYAHLGLESSSYRGEIFRDLECDGVYEGAVNLLKQRLITDNDFLDYCEENFERVGDEDKADMAFMESCIDQIDWGKYGTAIPAWLEAIWEVAQDDAWDKLQSEGKIGTYLAVPCRWNDNVHGPGTVQAYTTTIEDANAVWIPTQCDLDNIKATTWPAGVKVEWKGACGSVSDPLHAVVTHNGEMVFDTPKWSDAQSYIDANFPAPSLLDLQNAADKYAQSCLDEYVKWCNGDCYGIVVETFTKEGDEWVQTEEDACWGFIGGEYAEQEMKSVFDYACGKFLGEPK